MTQPPARRDPAHVQRGEIVIDTIILARELDLPVLLPAAFCSIPDSDRDTILLATSYLRLAYAKYIFGWLDEACADCAKPGSCSNTKLQYSLKLWKPPGSTLPLYWPSSAAQGRCNACVAVGKKHHSEGVRQFLKELPSFFKLPSWDELDQRLRNFMHTEIRLATVPAVIHLPVLSPMIWLKFEGTDLMHYELSYYCREGIFICRWALGAEKCSFELRRIVTHDLTGNRRVKELSSSSIPTSSTNIDILPRRRTF
ncbi:hypothetical protein B0H17DRAFT_1139136 [Mycena rosella]|uniref:Uncharacterized protein n=1 Tax=Mycena rosella TaxID=1033263 RepID=A0AAD7GCV4_MYCRO|nr:hypothetical protein B0H17DRAFT_1139136 [Mycena rosella]